MALIIDPDLLLDGKEITILTGSKSVKLTITGNLSTDGATLKCVYSKVKELWKSSSIYIAYPFPFTPITDEQFEVVNGWDWDKTVAVTSPSATTNLLRTGGWALKNTGSVTVEEWSGIITLGTLNFATSSDRVYYQQGSATGSAVDTVLQTSAGVNQAVQTYQGTSGTYTSYKTASLDYRSFFKIFVREFGFTYAASALTDIGVTTMTYQAYRFPLTNQTDLKIVVPDSSMSAPPYSLMSITYHTSSQSRSGLVGGSYNFHVIIDGGTASGTTTQIYDFVQYQLRQNVDIDAGTELAQVIGKTANALLVFVGDTLHTLQPSAGSGTFIDNLNATNINDVFFVDDTGVERVYPFAAVLNLQFGSNLVADSASIYHVFFTNDAAGANVGNNFGTAGAITVQDKNLVYISGNVGGSSSILWTYDYDGNAQRGPTSTGTDAPITVVAIGLNTAQYVLAQGTIQRSKTNAVSLVAPLERNYSNPP